MSLRGSGAFGRRLGALSWLVALGCAPLYESADGAARRPAGSDPVSLAAQAVGCWELGWQAASARDEGSVELEGVGPLPDSIALEGSVLHDSDRRLVTPATHPSGRGFFPGDARDSEEETWEQRYRANRWWVDDEERVIVLFTDSGSEGWKLALRPEPDGLTGSADPGGVPVRARRIACPPTAS